MSETQDPYEGSGQKLSPPVLRLDRAYPAEEAARFLGMTLRTFNERVRRGWILPVDEAGHRRYSGFVIAQKLGWPLTDDPMDYMPQLDSVVMEQHRDRLHDLIDEALVSAGVHQDAGAGESQ